ncbi:hypothetical protein SAY87_017680 [Trapa incisa]|uniref:Uncharacterized protein n=1 Tax=Trapa incisa TaxID=236973 RepID=A0AAN7KW75_9MYRT|nr:hypothetical protein SAY87_017680 [Trapa incisa]
MVYASNQVYLDKEDAIDSVGVANLIEAFLHHLTRRLSRIRPQSVLRSQPPPIIGRNNLPWFED